MSDHSQWPCPTCEEYLAKKKPTLNNLIAEVLQEHQPKPYGVAIVLRCTSTECNLVEWTPDHVAEAVVDALKLTEEKANIPEWHETGKMIESRFIQGPTMVPERRIQFMEKSRWVSEWTPT